MERSAEAFPPSQLLANLCRNGKQWGEERAGMGNDGCTGWVWIKHPLNYLEWDKLTAAEFCLLELKTLGVYTHK